MRGSRYKRCRGSKSEASHKDERKVLGRPNESIIERLLDISYEEYERGFCRSQTTARGSNNAKLLDILVCAMTSYYTVTLIPLRNSQVPGLINRALPL